MEKARRVTGLMMTSFTLCLVLFFQVEARGGSIFFDWHDTSGGLSGWMEVAEDAWTDGDAVLNDSDVIASELSWGSATWEETETDILIRDVSETYNGQEIFASMWVEDFSFSMTMDPGDNGNPTYDGWSMQYHVWDIHSNSYFGEGAWVLRVDTPVPEPTTFLLLGIGIAGIAGVDARRRRRKKTLASR